jgi:hypothetical protein
VIRRARSSSRREIVHGFGEQPFLGAHAHLADDVSARLAPRTLVREDDLADSLIEGAARKGCSPKP